MPGPHNPHTIDPGAYVLLCRYFTLFPGLTYVADGSPLEGRLNQKVKLKEAVPYVENSRLSAMAPQQEHQTDDA